MFLRWQQAFLVSLILLAWPQTANAAYVIGGSCNEFGETHLSDDQTAIIACLKKYSGQTDCGTAASPVCLWKEMTSPSNLVRISFEIVGGGGGGGGNDYFGGGSGGGGSSIKFDTYLPQGSQLTVSAGGGGFAGLGCGQSDGGDGGSGLMANGGKGGNAGYLNVVTSFGNPTLPGCSGSGGGGGAASVVMGDGLYVVAGGGGGGGGSETIVGFNANLAVGGALGMNGLSADTGCYGLDGGGGGGGGGGYPGGSAGTPGCDHPIGNLDINSHDIGPAAYGGNHGGSYIYAKNGTYAVGSSSVSSISPGVVLNGGSGAQLGGPAATNGQCGYVKIRASNGSWYQFICGNGSPPMWTVQ